VCCVYIYIQCLYNNLHIDNEWGKVETGAISLKEQTGLHEEHGRLSTVTMGSISDMDN
jgi:hypothetical protein